jgi:hypothetical protein
MSGHVLVIEEQGISYTILHEDDCPTEEWPSELRGVPPVTIYTCNVGRMVGDVGLEFLQVPEEYGTAEGWDLLPEGRYSLEFWSERHPAGPWGPEEWDAGVFVKEKL